MMEILSQAFLDKTLELRRVNALHHVVAKGLPIALAKGYACFETYAMKAACVMTSRRHEGDESVGFIAPFHRLIVIQLRYILQISIATHLHEVTIHNFSVLLDHRFSIL